MNLRRVTRTLIAPFVIFFAGIAAANARAEDRWVVPTRDDVALRCGSSSVENVVTTLKRDQVLRADMDKDGYVRVAYPAGTLAVVPMAEGDLKGGTVTLTRRSRLKAYCKTDPVMEECWRALMDDFLTPGTTLRHVGPINNRAGAQEGYVVDAPAGAMGWVLAGDVRAATTDEAKRAASAPAQPAAQPPAQPPASQPQSTQSAPTTNPETSAASEPATEAPGANQPSSTHEQPAAKPAAGSGTGVHEAQQPVRSGGAPARSSELTVAQNVKRLDKSLEALDREPIESAEFEPLLAEYEKTRHSITSSEDESRYASQIDTRIDLVRMRMDHQKITRSIKELEEKARKGLSDMELRIAKLTKGREYQAVGRLTASVLYDGKRLPLLYRLVSIDTEVPRTVAYINPKPGESLDSTLGAIVGVNGEGDRDPGARVRVITPTQLDVLQAAGAE